MGNIRWGIIGCGIVTEVKSGPGFQKAAGSELVAVMRRDGTKAADFAKRHGVARWYDEGDALIADKDVDAVYIATPPDSHEFYAMKTLAAGKPCYVEKPFARNTAEAVRMTEAFARKDVPLFVAFYRRAMPRYLKIKEIIHSPGFGAVKSFRHEYRDGQMLTRADPIPWRLEAEQSGGGLFLDLGSHVLDILDFFLGPLDSRHAHSRNTAGQYRVEDEVTLGLKTRENIIGEVSLISTSVEKKDEFEIIGEEATLRFSCFSGEPVRLAHRDGREELLDLPYPPHVAQPMIQTIVDELHGIGKCPSTGVSAVRTQRLMDAALMNYYGGREDGFWARTWPGAPVSVRTRA